MNLMTRPNNSVTTPSFSPLPVEVWTARAQQHHALVSPFADAYLMRRQLGQKNATHDFLFTYYNCSPLKLKQWVPSFEEDLACPPHIRDDYPWLNDYWFRLEGNVLSPKRERINDSVRGLASFVSDLCGKIAQRPPRFGCFGLHEWAMVYKCPLADVRHNSLPLRLAPDALAAFVESQTLCCSHYDAYRFFTPEARPLNTLQPQLHTRPEMEQAGCVHANMDLYKWAVKLWPWIGSDFIAKAFILALEARELDMRASPYDLSKEGYAPICVETENGRRQYQKEQQQLTERAAPLRLELLALCNRLICYQ